MNTNKSGEVSVSHFYVPNFSVSSSFPLRPSVKSVKPTSGHILCCSDFIRVHPWLKSFGCDFAALGQLVVFFFWTALLMLFCAGCETAPRNSLATHNSAQWEKEIAAFEAKDMTNPPPKGCIVFVGSSSIKRWTNLAADFPALPVINRGFGGSQLADSVNFAGRIIIPYEPRQVVIYAGGNDINAGKDSELVFGDFVALAVRIRAQLPRARIAYVSSAPNLKRWAQVEKVKRLNALAADYCHRHGMTFINVFPLMLGPDGHPSSDIFVEDGLHMNPKGYAIWKQAVGPHLRLN
jgi:lysophospholipase L1-like esterase